MPRFPRLAPDDGLLLVPGDVRRLDELAAADGIAGRTLMERAGQAAFRAIAARFARRPVLVACGPGNNGGDGWVVARLLREAGWPVRVTSLADPKGLKGDAKSAAEAWNGPWVPAKNVKLTSPLLVVDALFGAGLSRDIKGDAKELLEKIEAAGFPVMAIDVPSGVDGATGAVRGMAAPAVLTVTFVRKKPGLALLPGRSLAGEIVVADIGIPERHLFALNGRLRIDQPSLWLDLLPRRDAMSHKFKAGSALMIGGPATSTGAARMSAATALRIGAGLVTIAAEPAAIPLYSSDHPDLITKPIEREADLDGLLTDSRMGAVAIGPAAGANERTKDRVGRILSAAKRVVLDADALSAIAPCQGPLSSTGELVLTPHEGEFQRLFPDLAGARIDRARQAAARSNATIVLKGGDTIVAAPDGRTTIQDLDAPALATAGAGDVLTGAVLGLLAQGMSTFEAAAAAVRLHAEAGAALGTGLVASDLPRAIGGLRASYEQRIGR